MNKCNSLSDLEDHFNGRFHLLDSMLAFRCVDYDTSVTDAVCNEVLSLRQQLSGMSEQLQQWRRQISDLRVCTSKH